MSNTYTTDSYLACIFAFSHRLTKAEQERCVYTDLTAFAFSSSHKIFNNCPGGVIKSNLLHTAIGLSPDSHRHEGIYIVATMEYVTEIPNGNRLAHIRTIRQKSTSRRRAEPYVR